MTISTKKLSSIATAVAIATALTACGGKDAKTETNTTYLTLKEIEKALENHAFIRVNKSNIVAKAAIKKVDGNIIRLVNNEMIQIGEGYKEAFFAYIQSSLLKSGRS